MVPVLKNPPANAGDIRAAGLTPDQEDPLEKGMTTHSSILAKRIPGKRSLGATVHSVTKSRT